MTELDELSRFASAVAAATPCSCSAARARTARILAEVEAVAIAVERDARHERLQGDVHAARALVGVAIRLRGLVVEHEHDNHGVVTPSGESRPDPS